MMDNILSPDTKFQKEIYTINLFKKSKCMKTIYYQFKMSHCYNISLYLSIPTSTEFSFLRSYEQLNQNNFYYIYVKVIKKERV